MADVLVQGAVIQIFDHWDLFWIRNDLKRDPIMWQGALQINVLNWGKVKFDDIGQDLLFYTMGGKNSERIKGGRRLLWQIELKRTPRCSKYIKGNWGAKTAPLKLKCHQCVELQEMSDFSSIFTAD